MISRNKTYINLVFQMPCVSIRIMYFILGLPQQVYTNTFHFHVDPSQEFRFDGFNYSSSQKDSHAYHSRSAVCCFGHEIIKHNPAKMRVTSSSQWLINYKRRRFKRSADVRLCVMWASRGFLFVPLWKTQPANQQTRLVVCYYNQSVGFNSNALQKTKWQPISIID